MFTELPPCVYVCVYIYLYNGQKVNTNVIIYLEKKFQRPPKFLKSTININRVTCSQKISIPTLREDNVYSKNSSYYHLYAIFLEIVLPPRV